jgi:hypothetical protein
MNHPKATNDNARGTREKPPAASIREYEPSEQVQDEIPELFFFPPMFEEFEDWDLAQK